MSPIGRVFIIVNLVLAAAFIGFAGTFLQNHTNWKTQHDTVAALRQEENAAAAQTESRRRADVTRSESQ